MISSRNKLLVIALVVLASITSFFLFFTKKSPLQEVATRGYVVAESADRGKLNDAINAPVNFYGKVIDQNGIPVSRALITFSLINDVTRRTVDETQYSDADGQFDILNRKGYSLAIGVSGEGFYQIPSGVSSGSSFGNFKFGDTFIKPPVTSRSSPALFKLWRKNKTIVLHSKLEQRVRLVPGKETVVPLDDVGHVAIFACDIGDSNSTTNRFRWSWSARARGGQIYRLKDEFFFEAPVSGYLDQCEIVMDEASTLDSWSWFASGACYIKFDDGIYSRVDFYFQARSKTLWLNIFVNPTAESRTIEVDPKYMYR